MEMIFSSTSIGSFIVTTFGLTSFDSESVVFLAVSLVFFPDDSEVLFPFPTGFSSAGFSSTGFSSGFPSSGVSVTGCSLSPPKNLLKVLPENHSLITINLKIK